MQPVSVPDESAVPEATAPTPRPRIQLATFRALRHRNYRLYFFGQLVSLVGTWMQTTALMWLAFELVHQSRGPAWVQAMVLVPTCLLGPWAGALADRFPKQRLLFWTQAGLLLNALVLLQLVLSGIASFSLLLGVALVGGLIQALDLPTRLAFVMDMVVREDVANAVALNALLFNIARLIGPMLAGWLLLTQGAAACFLMNAISYLAVLIALLLMRIEPAPAVVHQGGGSLLSGFKYLLGRQRLLAVVMVAGTTAFCGWPFLSLLPALAKRVLAVHSAEGYSQMLSATGLGALVAALSVATFGSPERRRSFITTGVLLVSFGLVGLSLARTLVLALNCCAWIGFGLICCFSSSQAELQLSSEPHNRGRLLGIWAMTLAGSVPLGNLVVGPAADHWGETRVLAVQGMACAALAALIWWWSGFWKQQLQES